MLRKILPMAFLAGALSSAQAGSLMETTEHGAEVPLDALDLPAAEGGLLRFAACDGCETQTVVMSSGTRYLINRRAATFEELAAAVELASASGDIAKRSLVGLYFETASKRLVRIALVAPIPPPQ